MSAASDAREIEYTANVAAIGRLIEQAEAQLRELRAERVELVAALRGVVGANDEFRASLPLDWDGDPINDACIAARAVLAKVSP